MIVHKENQRAHGNGVLQLCVALGLLAAVCCTVAAGKHAGNDGAIKSLNVKRIALRDLTQMLSRGSGRNIVASEDAAQTPITIYLRDVTVSEAVRAICDANKLWYREREQTGLLIIMTLDEYKAGLSAFTRESVEVIPLRYLDTRDAGDALQRLFRDRVIWSRPDGEEGDALEAMERALERMDVLAGHGETFDDTAYRSSSRTGDGQPQRWEREARRLLTSGRSAGTGYSASPRLSPRAEEEAAFTEAEMVAAREALQAGIAAADARLGGKPGVVYVSSMAGTNRMMLRSLDSAAVEQVAAVVRELDRPKPQVLLEVKVLDLLLNEDQRTGIDWLFALGDVSGARSTGINSSTLGTAFGRVLNPDGDLVPQGTGLEPRALVLSAVTDQIAARLQLLADEGRVTSLATPNLCVADNEASRVFIGDEISILTELEVRSQFNEDGNLVRTDISPTTERRNVGTSLVITPTIHADRTATIRLTHKKSVEGQLREIYSFEGQSFQSQDISERSVTTTVIAQDQQIAAIGGLVRESMEDRRIGIPLLMDVPVLGALFGTTIQARERHELLVLIRPFILLAPGEGEEVSAEFLERISLHPSASRDLPALNVGQSARLHILPTGPPQTQRELSGVRQRARLWSMEPEE